VDYKDFTRLKGKTQGTDAGKLERYLERFESQGRRRLLDAVSQAAKRGAIAAQ
jgi:hypothetical protein